jgi:hypothetical protein
MNIIFYVNSHGFGHAKRATGIIRELLNLRRDVHVFVRTQKEFSAFAPLTRTCFGRPESDFFVVEADALRIDGEATARSLGNFLKTYDSTVQAEIDFFKDKNISRIISDVAFIAGDVGRLLDVPCIAVANFTWDWILKDVLEATDEGQANLKRMQTAYQKMSLVLQTPFNHSMTDTFGNVSIKCVPFALCDRKRKEQGETWLKIADKLKPPRTDFEHVLFYDIRGLPISEAILRPLIESFKSIFFLILTGDGKPTETFLPNGAALGKGFDFDDAFNACTVFVCKLGYCTVGHCIEARKRLLFPTRIGFREDDLLRKVSDYIPAIEISRESCTSGAWHEKLQELLNLGEPSQELKLNGASVCAETILAHFESCINRGDR